MNESNHFTEREDMSEKVEQLLIKQIELLKRQTENQERLINMLEKAIITRYENDEVGVIDVLWLIEHQQISGVGLRRNSFFSDKRKIFDTIKS